MIKRASVLGILFVIFLTSCFYSKDNTVSVNIYSNPEELKIEDKTSKIILSHIFEGLTMEDETGRIVPGAAESWEKNGKVWSFHIRDNAKWQNGEKLKAEDFVAAWEKVLSPENRNEFADLMYSIKGALEYNKGVSKDFNAVGIKAIDDNTLQIELNEELPDLYVLLAHPVFYPINKKLYEKDKEKYGTDKKHLLGNGPYEINSWGKKDKIVLKKSDRYWTRGKVKVKYIEMIIQGDIKKLHENYKNNKLDILDASSKELLEYKKTMEFKTFGTGEINFLQLNTANSFFSNKKIRKAIAMAIDRDEFIKEFQNGSGNVAESLIPENIFGNKQFFRKEYNQKKYGISYNVKNAKKMFQEGLKELGGTSVSKNLTLLVNAEDIEIRKAEFIKRQLKENINLDISIKTEIPQMIKQVINAREYDVIMGVYSSNVLEPTNYLKLFTSNSYNNTTGWANQEYDNYAKKVSEEEKLPERAEMTYNAEKTLMDELPIIPISFSGKNIVVKDRVKNVRFSNVTGELDFRFANIEKK